MSKIKKQYNGLRILETVLLVAIVLIAAGLNFTPASAASNLGMESTNTSKTLPPVDTTTPKTKKQTSYIVAKGQVLKELVLTGELKAASSTMINAPNIRSSFSNTVTFLAPEGAHVKQGERIVEFDDSSLLSNKSEAERTLDETKLNIQKKKADLEAERCDLLNSQSQAQASLKKDELYGKISKSLLAANTWQKYQLNLTKSKLSLDKANEQLANFERSYASQMALVEINRSQAEINLKKIESDMLFLKVDAPQDGILIYGDNWQSNRKIQPGDSLFQGMEVASLPDLSSMQIIGYVYDTEYGSLIRDMRCIITFDALPGYRIDGRIVSLTSVASRKGFTSEKKVFQTVVQLDRVDPSVMKPGMTARVRVPMILAKDVSVISREYLGTDTQGRYFVIKGTEPKKSDIQFVSLGVLGDREVQVVSGVSIGDPLIPIQRLAEVSK
jgi:HlyD family secretion protein